MGKWCHFRQSGTDRSAHCFAGSTPINSWFTQYGSRSINAVEALEYSSNTYMVQIALKMMGQPYTPNMTLQVDQVDPAMKNSVLLLQSTVLERQRGLTFPMNRPVLSRKSIQSVII